MMTGRTAPTPRPRPKAEDTAKPEPKPKSEDTVTVEVTPGVLVFHDGEQRGGTLQAPKDDAEMWAGRGWVQITG
jgi:hypothetical protein